MDKRLPQEVEFLQREREAILQEWRNRLETGVNSRFFSEGSGITVAQMGQVFDDLVNAIHKNLYRNLNVSFDALLQDGQNGLASLPVGNVRDFMFQFVPSARTILQRSHPEGDPGQAEPIYARLKVIERDLREVYSGRIARNLLHILQHYRGKVLERWAEELPTAVISDHFSVLDEEDRWQFLENTYDIYIAMLKGEDTTLIPPQGDGPARTRLNDYLYRVVEFYEPKGFLISDMQRAFYYPAQLLEPLLFHKLSQSASEYRVALMSLMDVLQKVTESFSSAYTDRQMKNYYEEVSVMLHRIKNKLTSVPTAMETILMIPKDENELAGDPMVLTTAEAEVLNDWLTQVDSLLEMISTVVGPDQDGSAGTTGALAAAWREYQGFIQAEQSVLDNVRYKLDVGTIEMNNELLHIVYDGGKMTNELALELQIRQNELYKREPPKRVEMDIYTLARRAYEESLPEAQSRNQKYEFIADDIGVYVFGVAAELKRPFIQIIENAIKYTPAEGSVTVKLEYEPHHILFAVTDSGIGIPPGEEELVFQLCERCSNAKDFNKAGTGTGLYNDRKIILQHNGQVWVESAGVGKGSTFFIRLPIHRRAQQAGQEEAA